MLPPKIMHIFVGLAFSDFFFLVKKVTLPWSNHIFKIKWEINFLTFFNTDRNAPKKNLNRNIDILISNLL